MSMAPDRLRAGRMVFTSFSAIITSTAIHPGRVSREIVGFFRELFGAGKLWGIKVIPDFMYDLGYVDMGLMVYAPAAFIVIGLMAWFQNEFLIKKKGQ